MTTSRNNEQIDGLDYIIAEAYVTVKYQLLDEEKELNKRWGKPDQKHFCPRHIGIDKNKLGYDTIN